jgi:hypothetical protein
MKKILFLSIVICASLSNTFAGILLLEGKYQDKNLYVQNGYAGNGVGFCTYEVTINGTTTTDEIYSSAFEIDFTAFQIKPGTPVVVEIKHKDDCTPKVLNPEALKSKATFEVISINIDKKGLLNWTTKNEMGSLPYVIEQFRWSKWIPVGEVQGLGKMDKNTYEFQTTAHSGENKFRVKQIGYGAIAKVSENVTFISTVAQPTYTVDKAASDIEFSGETMYEIYDAYGNIIKRGYGNNLNIATLARGSYYLCYDNSMADFIK